VKLKHLGFLTCLVVGTALWPMAGNAKDPDWDTWDKPARAASESGAEEPQTNAPKLFGALGIGVYRILISPAVPSACPFRPTCSRYTMAAIGRHGLLNGVIMGTDRLTRCHSFAFLGDYVHEGDGPLQDPPDRAPLPFLSGLGL